MTDTAIHADRVAETFAARIVLADPDAVHAADIGTLMLNVTAHCDLACAHCHQSSSPSRTEEMSRAVMLETLGLADIVRPSLIDITGGEPALWPHLRELVERATTAGHALRVRTNLVALARPECVGLPAFFAENRVALLGSIPALDAPASDAAVPHRPTSVTALGVLRTLADLGYGGGDGLVLDLAHNPPLGQLPRDERELAEELRIALSPLGLRFDAVREIANVPVGRLAALLGSAGTYRAHIDRLAEAFNPLVVDALACRHSIDVSWDGTLYDCDFNMGAGLRIVGGPQSVAEALALEANGGGALAALASRRIALGEHCFACTVGAGSG